MEVGGAGGVCGPALQVVARCGRGRYQFAERCVTVVDQVVIHTREKPGTPRATIRPDPAMHLYASMLRTLGAPNNVYPAGVGAVFDAFACCLQRVLCSWAPWSDLAYYPLCAHDGIYASWLAADGGEGCRHRGRMGQDGRRSRHTGIATLGNPFCAYHNYYKYPAYDLQLFLTLSLYRHDA